MNISFSLDGIDDAIDTLQKIADEIAPVLARTMNESAERTMTKSKDQYCPVDTGTLRSSGMVQTRIEGSVIETTLSYGGAAQAYAVPVHEINKNYRGGRQWKYLETPIKEDIDGYNTANVDAVMQLMEGP